MSEHSPDEKYSSIPDNCIKERMVSYELKLAYGRS